MSDDIRQDIVDQKKKARYSVVPFVLVFILFSV